MLQKARAKGQKKIKYNLLHTLEIAYLFMLNGVCQWKYNLISKPPNSCSWQATGTNFGSCCQVSINVVVSPF